MNFFVRHRPIFVIQRYVEINISPSLNYIQFCRVVKRSKIFDTILEASGCKQSYLRSTGGGIDSSQKLLEGRGEGWTIHNHISMTASLLAGSQYIGNKLITIVAHRCPFYPMDISQLPFPLDISVSFFTSIGYFPLCTACSPFSFSLSNCVASPL